LGKTGKQNINDIYNVVPLGMTQEKIPGSPLCKIYLTGNELKKLFELILLEYPRLRSYYFYYTGMQLTYNPDKVMFRKISEIKIGNETKGYHSVSFSKKDRTLYCIAANKYSMGFIAKLRRLSFGTFNVVAKNKDGYIIKNDNFLIDLDKNKEGIQEAKEWLAILDYIRSFPDLNGNGIPDVPEEYKTKVNSITIKN
jgi:5'-nucleotidase